MQIGSYLMVLWALGLEGTFDTFSNLGSDKELTALMADCIPLTVQPRRKPRRATASETNAIPQMTGISETPP